MQEIPVKVRSASLTCVFRGIENASSYTAVTSLSQLTMDFSYLVIIYDRDYMCVYASHCVAIDHSNDELEDCPESIWKWRHTSNGGVLSIRIRQEVS